MNRNLALQRLSLALIASFFAFGARAEDDAAARLARWQDLRHSVFGDRPVAPGDNKIAIEAPDRAQDAALVPITITIENPRDVKDVYFLIDDNPAPLAAHYSFGPAGDPATLKLRVRVNQYTLMHAVEVTTDGKLYETSRFIKAAGGCSAPAGSYDDAALAAIGQMKLRVQNALANDAARQDQSRQDPSRQEPSRQDQSREVQLLIRHPNFNGMQMDQITRLYTPARYLKATQVTFNGVDVVRIDSDISLSTDPALSFGLRGHDKGTLHVIARDSDDKIFEHSFDVPQEGS